MRIRLGPVSVAIVLGFCIRVALAFTNIFFVPLRQSSDAFGYLRKSQEFTGADLDEILTLLASNDTVMVLFGSLMYRVTDQAPVVLGVLMAILGTSVISLSYRCALELWGNKRVARAVAWSVALFPQLVLHSALYLREIPVSFCLVAAALCAVRYVKHNQINQVVGYFFWIFFGALFHSGVMVAMPALMVGMWTVRPRGGRGAVTFYITNTVAVLFLAGILYMANASSVGMDKFGGSLEQAAGTFEKQEMRDATGGAAYPAWLRVSGGFSDIWKVPFRLAALLYSPLVPFMIRSPGHLLGAVDAGLYLYLCRNIYMNWRSVKQNRSALVLLIVMLALYLLFSLGVSNFGTAIRHRAKMSPLLLVIAAGLPVLRRQARAEYRLKPSKTIV